MRSVRGPVLSKQPKIVAATTANDAALRTREKPEERKVRLIVDSVVGATCKTTIHPKLNRSYAAQQAFNPFSQTDWQSQICERPPDDYGLISGVYLVACGGGVYSFSPPIRTAMIAFWMWSLF